MPRDVDLDLSLDEAASAERVRAAAARRCGVTIARVAAVKVTRRVVDARRARARFRLSVRVFFRGDAIPREPAPAPSRLRAVPRTKPPVVIVGAGPAGLFAALGLAERGIAAVVVERGKPVQARRRDLAELNKRGVVNPESNYCFGEGGAGTYSDGKLYTRADKRGPVAEVLRVLAAHGAPGDILVDARPHIGSNKLPKVVTGLRETLESAGVPIRFEARVVDLLCDRNRVHGVRLADGEEIGGPAVVLAAGHSARDAYELALAAGARLEPTPFAVGVRVEHPQPLIDAIQYGKDAGHPVLPAAAYRLSATVEGRGVYTFCMCPGGWIVPATTEPEAVVVNGMSLSRRDSPFANSGVVVAIEPDDLERLGYPGTFGGLRFQADLERHAFRLGGGAQVAPAQRVVDFIAGRESKSLPRSSYRPGLRAAPRHAELPDFLSRRLRGALKRFARTMPGYDTVDAVAAGVESRSSSPLRVVRDARTLESPTLAGLYPCGEGAGYAGGIVSAALDGLKIAERIAGSR